MRLTHVSGPGDYAKVHRLVRPVASIFKADGRKLACGRTFHVGPTAAAWDGFPEDRHGMCQQCRHA